MIAASVLIVLALALGVWGRWSLLGLMDRADSLMAGGDIPVTQGIAYGPDARQTLDLYTPSASAADRPVVVFFHGGSWKGGDRSLYGFVGRALAEQGFVAIIPNYRLVPAVRFPAFVEDGAAAVAWARAQAARHGGDPDRIVVAGHSAGAHIAALLALDPQWLEKAGAPPDTVKALVGLSGPYDFLPFTTDAARDAFAGVAYPETTQPVSFARPDAPPALLGSGDADVTVRPKNSHALAGALTREGANARVVIWPGLDHAGSLMALARPFRSKAPVLAEVAAFIRAEARPHPPAEVQP